MEGKQDILYVIEHSIVRKEEVIDFGILFVALKASRYPLEGEEECVEDFEEILFLLGKLAMFAKGDVVAVDGLIIIKGQVEQEMSNGFV